jgi:ankyrin repeat protein
LAIVQYLVQQGADINQAARGGFTPLFAAVAKGHTEVANYLREQEPGNQQPSVR